MYTFDGRLVYVLDVLVFHVFCVHVFIGVCAYLIKPPSLFYLKEQSINLAQLTLRKVVKKPDFNIFQSLM